MNFRHDNILIKSYESYGHHISVLENETLGLAVCYCCNTVYFLLLTFRDFDLLIPYIKGRQYRFFYRAYGKYYRGLKFGSQLFPLYDGDMGEFSVEYHLTQGSSPHKIPQLEPIPQLYFAS